MPFPATLFQLAEKPPKKGKILRLDLSMSCNFQQLWFSWQNPPPPRSWTRKNSETGCIHFMQFPATLVQLAEPPPPKEGKIFKTESSHFRNFGSAGRKAPPPPTISAFSCLFCMMLHIWNTHGPHTINPHSDSSYPNIFFRLPTLTTFQNTHIYRSTGDRIMVQV